ncbi:hypothetical protein J7T55_011065 [Diaporthe amygdali]|uniref:uncharacterized protein n=1 Tax=Phomopsis amygdali TaxID=1214568 RepID=UPI0022FED824|nr:uncharacterized protein J7T55_011065 [Diaporthe amygdali]KAJ0106970.1 hypothetical protein J7T55_011065 [Diaporthe amygdali]
MSAMLRTGAAIALPTLGLPSKLAAVEDTMGTPLEGHSSDPSTEPYNIARPTAEALTPGEPLHLQSQPTDIQYITATNRESTSSYYDAHPELETAASSAAASDAAPGGQHSPRKSTLFRSKFLRAGAVLVFGALPLVVLPGVMAGVLTRQILVGIGLSSAIATVAGFFAGYYYHINRAG